LKRPDFLEREAAALIKRACDFVDEFLGKSAAMFVERPYERLPVIPGMTIADALSYLGYSGAAVFCLRVRHNGTLYRRPDEWNNIQLLTGDLIEVISPQDAGRTVNAMAHRPTSLAANRALVVVKEPHGPKAASSSALPAEDVGAVVRTASSPEGISSPISAVALIERIVRSLLKEDNRSKPTHRPEIVILLLRMVYAIEAGKKDDLTTVAEDMPRVLADAHSNIELIKSALARLNVLHAEGYDPGLFEEGIDYGGCALLDDSWTGGRYYFRDTRSVFRFKNIITPLILIAKSLIIHYVPDESLITGAFDSTLDESVEDVSDEHHFSPDCPACIEALAKKLNLSVIERILFVSVCLGSLVYAFKLLSTYPADIPGRMDPDASSPVSDSQQNNRQPYIDKIWARLLEAGSDTLRAEMAGLYTDMLDRDFGVRMETVWDSHEGGLRAAIGGQSRDILLGNGFFPYIILPGFLFSHPQELVLNFFDRAIATRPLSAISLSARHRDNLLAGSSVQFGELERVWEGKEPVYTPRVKGMYSLREGEVRWSQDPFIRKKVQDVIDRIIERVFSSDFSKKEYQEVVRHALRFMTIIVIKGKTLVYSDPDSMVVRPLHSGRTRQVLYLPEGVIRNYSINVLAELIFESMLWLFTYYNSVETEDPNALRAKLGKIVTDFTVVGGFLGLTEKEEIARQLLDSMRDHVVELALQVRDAIRVYQGCDREYIGKILAGLKPGESNTASMCFREVMSGLQTRLARSAYYCALLGARRARDHCYNLIHQVVHRVQECELGITPAQLQAYLVTFDLKINWRKKFLEEIRIFLTGEGYPRPVGISDEQFTKEHEMFMLHYAASSINYLRRDCLDTFAYWRCIAKDQPELQQIDRIEKETLRLFQELEQRKASLFTSSPVSQKTLRVLQFRDLEFARRQDATSSPIDSSVFELARQKFFKFNPGYLVDAQTQKELFAADKSVTVLIGHEPLLRLTHFGDRNAHYAALFNMIRKSAVGNSALVAVALYGSEKGVYFVRLLFGQWANLQALFGIGSPAEKAIVGEGIIFDIEYVFDNTPDNQHIGLNIIKYQDMVTTDEATGEKKVKLSFSKETLLHQASRIFIAAGFSGAEFRCALDTLHQLSCFPENFDQQGSIIEEAKKPWLVYFLKLIGSLPPVFKVSAQSIESGFLTFGAIRLVMEKIRQADVKNRYDEYQKSLQKKEESEKRAVVLAERIAFLQGLCCQEEKLRLDVQKSENAIEMSRRQLAMLNQEAEPIRLQLLNIESRRQANQAKLSPEFGRIKQNIADRRKEIDGIRLALSVEGAAGGKATQNALKMQSRMNILLTGAIPLLESELADLEREYSQVLRDIAGDEKIIED
jgi:hypothetical protein